MREKGGGWDTKEKVDESVIVSEEKKMQIWFKRVEWCGFMRGNVCGPDLRNEPRDWKDDTVVWEVV